MSAVVDHLADLTGFRDRDLVDVTLVSAFRDLLQPQSVAIYRLVGEAPTQHWLTRARLRAGESTPSADSVWTAAADLPALDALPHHQRCLAQQQPVCLPQGRSTLTLFALSADGDAAGVLEVLTEKALGEAQRSLVCSVLRVYRNLQSLLDYSERDTLTGLLNRKTFDDSFLRMTSQETAGIGRSAGPLVRGGAAAWLGVVDIDRFKLINDHHGHLIGDEVLLLLGRLMRSSFRYQDQLYRFGGEEFVVLLRADEAGQALAAYERLRRNVAAYAFPRVGQVTISIGFTEVRSGDSPASAFERADKAVYHAKDNGRDRVIHYGDLLAEGVLAEEAHVGDVELF